MDSVGIMFIFGRLGTNSIVVVGKRAYSSNKIHTGEIWSWGKMTHIKETHKFCRLNLGQYFQIGNWLDKYGWTNCRGLDKCP